MMNIQQLANKIEENSNIVFFGGAGVSTASNIPDFRSAQGVFHQQLNTTFSPEELVSHSFYVKYPEEFFKFYKEKLIYPHATPNACHIALAKLENTGKLKAVVTQNIDGLHQKAGSKTVYELHGSVHRNYCEQCNAFYGLDKIIEAEKIPTCTKCHGTIKPDVVLYGEGLDQNTLQGAVRAIAEADMLIVGGTSLAVHPAAGLLHYFQGKDLVNINKTSTSADRNASLILQDDIAEVFEKLVQQMQL